MKFSESQVIALGIIWKNAENMPSCFPEISVFLGNYVYAAPYTVVLHYWIHYSYVWTCKVIEQAEQADFISIENNTQW